MVDLTGPCIDTACDRLTCIESLLAQPVGHAERSDSVVAKDEQALIGVKFLMCARWNIAHRHEQATIDLCGCVFPWLANIDELRFAIPKQAGCILSSDFVIVHS